ncbi:MAG: hypothetical protein H7061_11430 [Bdellovibrionaceae bacterium]|nr:hypothetical protein [Bdellovibrio sp.]
MGRILLFLTLFVVQPGLTATALYLTPLEKAVIAIGLRARLSPPAEGALFISKLGDRLAKLKGESSVVVKVQTFEEFLVKQRDFELFDDYALNELPIDKLFKRLKNMTYKSISPRIQRQIEAYRQQRRELLIDKSRIAGSLALKSFPVTEWSSFNELKEQIQLQFKLSLETLTARLASGRGNSPEILILGEVLKMYYGALPIEQKVEIFYRLLQLPLNSDPMDIFLTMLQHSGPQLQKLMQIIGRSEEIPKEFRNVFEKLESGVKQTPWWKVENLLRAEGIDPAMFSYFERKALGVGTMAQAHRTQLNDVTNGFGRRELVIRFLKPGIEKLLEIDHQILIKTAAIIDSDSTVKKYKLPSLAKLVEDQHRSVVEELNLQRTNEDQNFGKTTYNFKQVLSFSRQKNLVSFHVPQSFLFGKNGKLMAQELIIGNKPAKEFQQYALLYPDLYRAVAEELAAQWLDQAFFKSGFFHADLHQGNLMVAVTDAEIKVNILDFGMTGRLNKQLRDSALLLGLGIKFKNAKLIAKHLMYLAKPGSTLPNAASFTQAISEHMAQIKNDKSLDGSLEGWTLWALERGVELHYEFLKLNRGLTAIQNLLSHSKSDLTIESLAQKVAFRNKTHITKLVYNEPLLKPSELPKYFGSLVERPAAVTEPVAPDNIGGMQCRNLFL